MNVIRSMTRLEYPYSLSYLKINEKSQSLDSYRTYEMMKIFSVIIKLKNKYGRNSKLDRDWNESNGQRNSKMTKLMSYQTSDINSIE